MRRLLLVAALGCIAAHAQEGAAAPKYKLWSLQPVARPAVPAVGASNPIDAFIASKLKDKGLRANGPADRLTLLRRVYFDLVGLPPAPAEQDAFLADTSADAYEKLIDRLLDDPQHGVRWARHWLDVLRYADLDGVDGGVMPASSGIHHWRDWAIAAINHDMPYDQFVRAQILGNRSSNKAAIGDNGMRVRREANPQDQFALGFLARGAIHPMDRDQDLAISAVETISSAFLGMTVGCAKCHDHRFDPIKQSDYYSMKAIFDPLTLRKVTVATAAELQAHGDAIEAYYRAKQPIDEAIEKLIGAPRQKLYDERVSMLPTEVQTVIRKSRRTVAEQKIADDYAPVLRIDPPKIKEVLSKEDRDAYTALLEQQSRIKKPEDLPNHWIVEEDSARLKEKTYILTSGDPMRPEKDKPVEPGFPFKPADVDFRDGRREGFVDWLTAADNPLFARVAVNRIWAWRFGEGLQKVTSDFGLLGGRPSNQQLLDYLAAEFAAHNYSMKWLHRLMLTSNTYKASSAPFAANQKIDPDNTYLWRFPLLRLEAEPIWDAILTSSGELDLAIGGKSFQAVSTDDQDRTFLPPDGMLDKGRRNRRAAYMARGYTASTEFMPNFLKAFDVDDGRVPCPQRLRTVTAPQALYTMNGELVERASERFAEGLAKETSGDLPAAVQLAFRKAIGRKPSASEMDRALSYIGNDTANLKGLGWLLFNLDEFLFVK